MSNIQEKTITGKSWKRSSKQVISTPYGATPMCDIMIEEMYEVGGNVIAKPIQNKHVTFDPTKTFPKTNPATGEVIGEWSQAELQHIWYDFVIANIK